MNCPTCSQFVPTAEQERAIRVDERRFLVGLLAGDRTKDEVTQLVDQLGGKRGLLARFLYDLVGLCATNVYTDPVDRKAAIAERRRKRLGLS